MEILEQKPIQLQTAIQTAPLVPGCYMYKNAKNKIIYIGKAKNIRNRVKSYFSNFLNLDSKTQSLVANIESVEFFEVDSEFEALILESNLIKKYRPKYNILLKDDKNYSYVRFEKVRKKNMPNPTRYSVYQDFPRINVVRGKKEDGAIYFGPYPDSTIVKRVLRRIRKVYAYRFSPTNVYIDYELGGVIKSTEKKPDLYYHIGLSHGVESGLQSKESYLKNFRAIKEIFRGNKISLLNSLEREMKEASKNLDFEKAAILRNKFHDLKYIAARISIDNTTDDVVVDKIMQESRDSSMVQLVEYLKFPADKLYIRPNLKVECYDISNIQGRNAVGAMTVAIDGKLSPQLYRKFRIRMKNEPNDFGMLMEVLGRRFAKFDLNKKENNLKVVKPDESFDTLPDLIIIDGGKGQLGSVYKILEAFGLDKTIPVVGLAKREEEIFKIRDQFTLEDIQLESYNQFERILLPKRSQALFFVQRIRDEAHRFGITYHRKLRSKSMVS